MRVPAEVKVGKVKITLSCPDSKGLVVTPVTIEETIRE